MRKILSIVILMMLGVVAAFAQANGQYGDDGFTVVDGASTFNSRAKVDTTKNDKQIPKGVYVWTIDPKFGDRTIVDRDTVFHLFQNSVFTEGRYGEYNTTGNLGAPRINRIFIDRPSSEGFHFDKSYDYFLVPIEQQRFTNTLSPVTTLDYHSCGDKTDGEDHLKALFAVNAGKRIGVGMKFDYLYGRGYYQNQATSLFDWTFWGSYMGDKYEAQMRFTTDHIKITENGGITNDLYIKRPESFNDDFLSSEIPVLFNKNWNRVDAVHGFLTHRYSLGFNKKVPMTEKEIEARKFAIAAEKEKQERELRDKAKSSGVSMSQAKPASGRPADAKIMGDLVKTQTDSTQNDRIRVVDNQIVDTLLAQQQGQKKDTSWMKNEFVPVTSFIHTLQIDNYDRKYTAYSDPSNYYRNVFNLVGEESSGKSNDTTDHLSMRNIFGISMLEGFNKWMKMGFKLYAAHDYKRYTLRDTVKYTSTYNENTVSVGAQLLKSQGRVLHYNVTGELGVLGSNIGDVRLDGDGDVNFTLFGDTTRVFLKAFFHETRPSFSMRHFHGKHFWWDNNNLNNQLHLHLEGKLNIQKTKTTLRVAYDNLENYTYYAVRNDMVESTGMPTNYSAAVRQSSQNISLFTAELYQDFRAGILNWENRITYQHSTVQDVLPVPMLNVWTNLYLSFRFAKVLDVHFGAEAIYFTSYDAPEWSAPLATYAVQENAEVRTSTGDYPFVNLYANLLLKGCRFYVMMSHVNASSGNYFTTPHHPMNQRVFRIGLSWNIFN